MILLYFLLVHYFRSQPCNPPITLLSTSISGSCGSAMTTTYSYTTTELGAINNMDEYTITTWFKVTKKNSLQPLASIFRLTMNSADTTGTTVDGIRVALLVSTDADTTPSIKLQYATQAIKVNTLTNNFDFIVNRWIWAAVSVSHTTGKLNYYAWQPSLPTLKINSASTSLIANFIPPLTQAATKIELLNWGVYTQFCGVVDSLHWLPNHFEGDSAHNWLNLAFWVGPDTPATFSISAYYKLEDQIGQVAKNYISPTNSGYQGYGPGIDPSSDGTFSATGFATLTSSRYLTLNPFTWMTTSQQIGLSLWFKTNAVILADADFTDGDQDLILLRRQYKGTTDALVLMIMNNVAPNQYVLKLKLHGTIYAFSSQILTQNTWQLISVRLAYPASVRDLGVILIDVISNSVITAHQTTLQANVWQEDPTDKVFIGDGRNSYTGNMQFAHAQFYPQYVGYFSSAGLQCTQSCQLLISSPEFCIKISLKSIAECVSCKTPTYLQFPGYLCGAGCIEGDSGQKHSQLQVCMTCNYKCSSCDNTGKCFSCSAGYYHLQASNTCVTATSCGVGFIADQTTSTCTKCGNGTIDAGESCDDGNFISGDGCFGCSVEPKYSCSNAVPPSVCTLICGNGQLNTGETCDDGNYREFDGCYQCQIEDNYQCTGSPSVCVLTCGNGFRTSDEECDDGNYNSGDGCSMLCQVEIGYSCINGTPVTKDVCTKRCGNGIVDIGEQCDDTNNLTGDGCFDCIIEPGWDCIGLLCTTQCGNGIREQNEDCDDGNTQAGDGCSSCQVDQNFKCSGGTLTNKDTCQSVVDACGDSYKKTNELCEDGNADDGDGCSRLCIIETGYTCQNGLYPYSVQSCSPICGDTMIIDPETCDDGNILDGDGCSSKCLIEGEYCGNGVREPVEACDDGNLVDGDGCSSTCVIEVAWTCHLAVGSTVDICQRCASQCSNCGNSTIEGCTSCLSGYIKHISTDRCEPECPNGFFESFGACILCPLGCSKCLGVGAGQCTQCDSTHVLLDGACLDLCADGYFNQLNAVYGNICEACFSPCLVCTDAVNCSKCQDLYYIENDGSCQLCGMGENCIECDKEADTCTKCKLGYNPEENKCVKIVDDCGDGLRSSNEKCDDGNQDIGDGCDSFCNVEKDYACVLQRNQGPDECFQLIPLDLIPYTDLVHFDTLYLEFTRPLVQGLNFSSLLSVNIPSVNGYKYSMNMTNPNTLAINFTFNVTVRFTKAYLNFSKPNEVVDKFGWTLVGQQNVTASKTKTKGIVTTELNYYIHYDEEEHQFAETLGLILLSFACLAGVFALAYSYKIGDGRQWKIVESMQLIGMLRFVNLRYSLHMNTTFSYLNYFSLTFIPNLFEMIDYDDQNMADQTPSNFQISNYSPLFLLNSGGRLISIIAYALIIHAIVAAFVRLISWEPLQDIFEEIQEYMQVQFYVRVYETMFLDLMISTILNFKVFHLDDPLQQASLAMAIINLLFYAAVNILFGIFIIRIQDAVGFLWLHKHFACVYDGFNMRTILGKAYILIPYIQKWSIAIVLVISEDPTIQVSVIMVLRVLPLLPFPKFSPFSNRFLVFHEVFVELVNVATIGTTLSFLDYYAPKLEKVSSGWVIALAVLLNTIHWCAWNIGFFFIKSKVATPDYVVEEAEGYHKPQAVPQDSQHDMEEKPNLQNQEQKSKSPNEEVHEAEDYRDVLRKRKLQRQLEEQRQLEDLKIIAKQPNQPTSLKEIVKDAKEVDDFFGTAK